MLIEFSVANFRSIRERQTLSMVANNSDKSLPDNVIDVDLPGLKNTKFLKSAAIYGANASGKSNLYMAAWFMRSFIVDSVGPDGATGVQPFRLDAESETKPSEFEVLFSLDGIRYQYGFCVDEERVHEEWLIAYPVGSARRLLTRTYDPHTERYDLYFNQKHLKGRKTSLQEETRDNVLLLTMGAHLHHEQLTRLYMWFRVGFGILGFPDATKASNFTKSMIADNEEFKESVLTMLRGADLGISGLESKLPNPDELRFPEGFPAEAKNALLKSAKGKNIPQVRFAHRTKDTGEEKVFDEGEESTGTLKLLDLSGPWLDVLEHGYCIIVDEIGANLHPLLVRNLIQMMHSPELNQHGAQLIFTTHDTTLLDTELMRRDQIWLTEKDEEGATHLYPLTDFKPRKDEALQKGYLAGRYGAIPFLKGEFSFE